MKREGLLLHASDLMQEVDFVKCYKAHVCFWDGNLCCLPANHTQQAHPVFLAFTESIQTIGLTRKDWDILDQNLWKFFKEKI